MKKILLPIDGSKRSIRTVEYVKKICTPEDEIHLVKVVPGKLYLDTADNHHNPGEALAPELEMAASELLDYTVHTKVLPGSSPGVELVAYAKAIHADGILLTRSTRTGLRRLGSVANYLVKNADFLDLFLLRDVDEDGD